MAKNKAKKFKENESFSLLYQPTLQELFNADYYMKGRWGRDHFKNSNPIILELGCGRGEYSVELSRRFPNINLIGIDIKGARIWRGAKSATEEKLSNVAFIRTKIDFIQSLFAKDEISEIWITFPDPQVRKERKRLTSTLFLERYRSLLIEGGIIHLKTDSEMLHNYTLELVKENNLEIIEADNNLYGSGRATEITSIKTRYESQFLAEGLPITYLSFRLRSGEPLREPNFDAKLYSSR